MKRIYVFALALAIMCSNMTAQEKAAGSPKFEIVPVEHASMVVRHGEATIYIDPVGEASQYAGYPKPDIILITHIHRDHLAPALLDAVRQPQTVVLGPQSVQDQYKDCKVIANGDKTELKGISVEAVPAYNTTEERLKYHPKERGDHGYVLQAGGERLYISGDTEDITEMRALKDIDHAIICMNLPYTMTEEAAASAVLEMKPKKVTPYHYRGAEGISDLKKFQDLVSEGDKKISIKLLEWYPAKKQ